MVGGCVPAEVPQEGWQAHGAELMGVCKEKSITGPALCARQALEP